MSIVIVSAKTGRGHISVMNTLAECFADKGYKDCKCIPDFYESILPSNRILSDFYNFLLTSSTALCEKYVQFTTLTRPDRNEELYQMTKSHYAELFTTKGLQAIVSTAISVNHSMIQALKEEGLYGQIPFYIVVTDPYDPIAPGFDIPGATRYFCANETVKNILAGSGIDADKIMITGYPVSKRFCSSLSTERKEAVFQKLGLNPKKKVVLLNSGSQGGISSLNLLRRYLESDIDVNMIMLCGTNKSLYRLAKIEGMKTPKSDLLLLPFYEWMEELLAISDVYITKAGANSFYEAVFSQVPLLIDATEGYLYQERGVTAMLDEIKIGRSVEDISDFTTLLQESLREGVNLQYKARYKSMDIKNGANPVVETILSDVAAKQEK